MPGSVYTAEPQAELRRVDLDGLTLLFHEASGATHILAPPAPQILAALAEGPAQAEEILARIEREWDLESGASGAIAARLAELEAAGLVHRSPLAEKAA